MQSQLEAYATLMHRAQKNGAESELSHTTELALDPVTAKCNGRIADYFLRWRILALIRRFFLPTFRRPFPVRFVPTR
ncbi:hypothetical protein MFFC18_03150 [Mariniblastus fucicola]|uniref:Uncharacterized protein n=1 Tax=Mariniblastus fucicola TaxID=980251 RepID=A0A5B9P1T5_9BACT|nr:hypothetical protein MFFC18_03150 [Mariniblastus fucicola]